VPLTRVRLDVIERLPHALPIVDRVCEALRREIDEAHTPEAIDALRHAFGHGLRAALQAQALDVPDADTTPRVHAAARLAQADDDLVTFCDGAWRRAAIAASITDAERLELLRGMLLTRATDNRLKQLFMGGDVRYRGTSFQGKGFRSLGQEAIYACALRLRRGPQYRGEGDAWHGDIVAPMIRDLGASLAMRPDGETVRRVLAAQMAKADACIGGRDLHHGEPGWGVLPPAAPLTIATLTIAGLAFAMAQDPDPRVAVSFIGDGGSSLGEWHEAINACAVRRLPAIFCIQNNQTALSTPLDDQTRVRTFADKASGYGIPGLTVDGTDPEAIATAFAWAAERARARLGPTLIELVAMRICGHAHHDDMLYLGKDAPPSWTYPALHETGYADADAFAWWSARDPIATYAAHLVARGVIGEADVEALKREAEAVVERQAQAVIAAEWPDASTVGTGVCAGEPARTRVEVLDPAWRLAIDPRAPGLPPLEPFAPFDKAGRTFLDAVMLGVGDALRADPRTFVFGQDVGAPYGNAFLLLRPLLAEFGHRIVNAPLAEGAILGIATGAALGGLRPIAEMQFNDFVATGFNQLVNNAAKVRYRWGGEVPMVVRMPWGGLRHAGPYHSQNTEAWFYRTPGLRIVVPSSPTDARALLALAVADPDPVLYYEHIALYRDPRLRQVVGDAAPGDTAALRRAALRRAGSDLAIISYGAYVHVAMRVADTLAQEGIGCSVLDLRWLAPLDRPRVLQVARHCGRVLVVHEDTRTGGIGESLAAIIQEEAFEFLDAPVRIIGALDTPVPYAPPLEEAFLPSEGEVLRAARLLAAY
jgi:2-oxoisovalerate dehydrogenase E1 component